jgi:HD-GYP domain-containing protein (c-di-GMP phosphodiesterase class II)
MNETKRGAVDRQNQADLMRRLVEIGIALSAERNHERLIEKILIEAKSICNADGGTLYLYDEEHKTLRFAIMRSDSLDVALGGTTGNEIPYPPLQLYEESGRPNLRNVATYVAHGGFTVNIRDAYEAENFDFSGTQAFDERMGYRSTSFLTVPLKDHEDKVTGVLQLINATDPESGEVIAFDVGLQPVIEALASQAAVAIDNQDLLDGQRILLESFIRLIAGAIDMKSPYTGAHCQRVPVVTEMLAKAACEASDGPLQDFVLDEEEFYELHIAAWLHDCGKVTTPEYVVDKATKLETIYDRVEVIRTRFELVKREAEIKYLKALAEKGADAAKLREEYNERLTQLDDDRSFIAHANVGAEFMDKEHIDRVHAIAKMQFRDWDGEEKNFLSDDEVHNLCIPRGTLTPEERKVINHHIEATIEMLEKLPFPKHLSKVPEFAGGHHERMDGKGYPRGLTRDEMSIPARIMAIADVFEALTASDRPYKDAKTLSETVRIMSNMKRNGHIDPDLFDLFVESGVYQEYADEFLKPEQIDEVDVQAMLA